MSSFVRAVCKVRIRRGYNWIPVGEPVDLSVEEFESLNSEGLIDSATLYEEWTEPQPTVQYINVPKRSVNYASERRRIHQYEESVRNGNGRQTSPETANADRGDTV